MSCCNNIPPYDPQPCGTWAGMRISCLFFNYKGETYASDQHDNMYTISYDRDMTMSLSAMDQSTPFVAELRKFVKTHWVEPVKTLEDEK